VIRACARYSDAALDPQGKRGWSTSEETFDLPEWRGCQLRLLNPRVCPEQQLLRTDDLRSALSDYIEGFYNPTRSQRRLDYHSPADYEQHSAA
jgi:transposase InsO family protein